MLHCTGFLQLQSAMRAFFAQRCLWEPECGIFSALYRKIHQLEAAKKEILITEEHLPHPDSLAEEQYQEMLGLLQEEKKRIEQEKEQQFQEMMEYYTMWAHQIKTPIAASRLILQSAQEECCDENRQEVFLELKEEISRIDQYADMVMCYLRLDTGTTDYVIREYELDGIVRQAVQNVCVRVHSKKAATGL